MFRKLQPILSVAVLKRLAYSSSCLSHVVPLWKIAANLMSKLKIHYTTTWEKQRQLKLEFGTSLHYKTYCACMQLANSRADSSGTRLRQLKKCSNIPDENMSIARANLSHSFYSVKKQKVFFNSVPLPPIPPTFKKILPKLLPSPHN